MIHKRAHTFIQAVSIVLWVLIVGGLVYMNHVLQKRVNTLEQQQSLFLTAMGNSPAVGNDLALELASLIFENKTYRADLKRQRTNLKECMAQLPQEKVDDFYRRHREELSHEQSR